MKRFRIDCPGSAANIDHELAEYLRENESSGEPEPTGEDVLIPPP